MTNTNGQVMATYPFLRGGGEMGHLTRSFDWSRTQVGPPDTWPPCLRTTVSTILRSKFPMFLFWGEDNVCFYNDSFRGTLGDNGKHPALGKRGKEVWPEAWDVISAMIKQVKQTEEAIWHEDQLVPIFRNGRLENVYWTFSYSPVLDEMGEIAGVLSTCIDTTEKVLNRVNLHESKDQLQFAIDAADLATWDFNPLTNKFTASEGYKEWFGIEASTPTDSDLSIATIAEEDRERVINAMKKALDFKFKSDYDIEFTVRPVSKPERIVRAKGKAWFNEDNIAYRFSGTLQDVTAQAMVDRKIAASEQNFKLLVKQAPVPIAVFRGHNLVAEIANDAYLAVVDKKSEEFIDRPLFESLPEVRPVVEPIIDTLMKTGKPFITDEIGTWLTKNGIKRYAYFSLVYEPLFDAKGKPDGFIVVANELTEQVISRKKAQESEARLQAIIQATPDCIKIVDDKGTLQFMNSSGLGMIEGDSSLISNACVYDVVAPEYRQAWIENHKRVIHGEGLSWQFEIVGLKGTRKYMETHAVPLNEANEVSHLAVTRDISERKKSEFALKRNEIILRGQKQALELAVNGATLSKILDVLTETVETQASSKVHASILLLDAEQKHLLHGSGPSLPKEYNEALHGIGIGPNVGSCGTAAYTRKEVVVSDIATNDLWINYKDLALKHGLRACWSTPIVSSSNELLATFAIYYTSSQAPPPEDREAIELLSRTAGIIIEWVHEIEQRKATEERLRLAKEESEKRKRLYEAITSTTLDLIYVFDLDYKFLYANEALLTMWGRSWNDSIGKGMRELGYEEWHAEMHEKEIDKVVSTKLPIRGEVSFPHATLGRRVYDYIFTPVINESGEVEVISGTTRDITEIKNAEAALKESEAKFRRFYESNMLAIAFWNVDGKVYDCNEAFAGLVGVERQQIVDGKYNWMDGTAPEYQHLHSTFVNEAIESKIFVRPYEVELIRPDGNRIFVLVGYTMLEGSSENGVAFLMDITVQKSMLTALEYRVLERTKELNEVNLALQQSNEDLLQFAHVASHDLKEPVRKIKTFGYRLQDELPQNLDRPREFLNKMLSSASRMSTMIDGVLSYSSVNATPDSAEQIDLNAVFEDIRNDLEVVITQKNALIKVDKLPEIFGNRFLLHQLFYNLINNALKFTNVDEIPVIAVKSESLDEKGTRLIRIFVSDNGIGFDQVNAERIFETFSRLNPKDKFEGTGLGLALCKKIVQRHHGQISAFSEAGKGATFVVTLPINTIKGS